MTPDLKTYSYLKKLLLKPTSKDLLLLSLTLFFINTFFASGDIGFLQLNPSPYFFIPPLIGALHGTLAGGLAGILTSLLIMLGRSSFGGDNTLLEAIQQSFYFLLPSTLCGMVCGELTEILHRRIDQQKILNAHIQTRLHKLDKEMFFLKETKDELDRAIATHNADLATLDVEIRRLSRLKNSEIYAHLLLLLHRRTRVMDGAIYTFKDNLLERQAHIGDLTHLPQTLSTIPIVEMALKQKTFVAIQDLWNGQTDGLMQPHLLAIPLISWTSEPYAVLLVSSIAFMSFHRKNVEMIEMICDWSAGIAETCAHHENVFYLTGPHQQQRVFSHEFFQQAAQRALKIFQQHDLKTFIVQIKVSSSVAQRELENIILPVTRTGDFAATLAPHSLTFLLPFTGERGATIFIKRITEHAELNGLSQEVFHIDHAPIAEAFTLLQTPP